MDKLSGLQFDVKSSELQELLGKQVDICTKQAESNEAYIEQLRQSPPSESVAKNIALATSAQVIARARAESFRWLGRHVVSNETYRLSIGELAHAGIVQGFGPESVTLTPMFQRPVSEQSRANA